MNDRVNISKPEVYYKIVAKTEEIGFTMPSDEQAGSLLKTLVSSKSSGRFLDLGTGTGLSLSWIVDGMDQHSSVISMDNDLTVIEIANQFFSEDPRVSIVCTDGSNWILKNKEQKFDLIFADTWPGKYSELEETLEMVKVGGIYLIDDMNPQPNWPDGHDIKATNLVKYLEGRADFAITKLSWSTGIIIAVRIR
jgi:predicted O-methyltransferase YrrM